jgi:hypothetical protein
MIGSSIPLLASVASRVATGQLDADQKFLVSVYQGFGVPILLMYALTLCISIWELYRINWVLILELDERDHISIHQFTEVMSALTLYYSFSFYAVMVNLFNFDVLVYPIVY